MKKLNLFLLSGLLAFAFTACDNDDNSIDEKEKAPSTEVLTNISNNVIVSTYTTLETKAKNLQDAIDNLKNNKTAANLETARTVWREARIPWEQSEAFLFGPTDENGLDPALDTWPVDVIGMNTILQGSMSITAQLIAVNDNTRGFHLIEFLLWGENSDKTITNMTEREFEYLMAASHDLVNSAITLKQAWTPYANLLATAGEAGNLKFKSTRSGLEELAMGMVTIADEVGNEKIENPLNGEGSNANGKPHYDLEESRFSNNSKTDYINNIESISNIYLGTYNNKNGKGISDILVFLDFNDLDAKIKNRILSAQKAIEDIPGTFTQAIGETNTAGRTAVRKAQEEVRILHRILEEELLPIINDSNNNI